MSELPVFAYCTAEQQATQLRSYLKDLGANIDTTSLEGERDAVELVEACPVIGKRVDSEPEIEMVLNSIVSLIVVVPRESVAGVVERFCEKLCGPEFGVKTASAVIQVLSNLFHGFSELDKRALQYKIYCSLLKVAGASGLVWKVPTNLATLKKWFDDWQLNVEQRRSCLRLLHDALGRSGQTEASARVMLELLGTYTDADAAHARDDAFEAIRMAILDPGTFIFDNLLLLRPVQILKSEKIYALLQIFVSGSLSDYVEFHKTNKAYVEDTLKLSNDANINKMRMLTLMSIAEKKSEISFEDLSKHLGISGDEELEDFIIRSVIMKVIKAKMNQMQKRLIIGGVRNRMFGRSQWEQLRARLEQWESALGQVSQTLETAIVEQ